MKKLLAIAMLLLASTAAQAQYTFEYGGRTIRIDPDRGTVQIPGVYDNTGKAAPSGRRVRTPPPPASQNRRKPRPIRKPLSRRRLLRPSRQQRRRLQRRQFPPLRLPRAEPSTTTAAIAPADTAVAPPAPPPLPNAPPQVNQQNAAPPPAPAPTIAAAPPSSPSLPPSAVVQANSPVGVWLTEEKEGKVRIEQCGTNLCGYSVDKKSNQNGEQVLINMKPGKDKWSGRIFDPNTGSTYDSTIALKGSDTLRVQGCAFGGMFCGGQTWTRVN